VSRHTTIKGLVALAVLVSISCSFFAQSEPSRPIPSEPSPTSNQEISLIVSASEGGELTLPDKTVLRIPPGSLQNDTPVSMRKITAESIPTAQQELVIVGDVYDINLGTDGLEKPATLEIPFDPTLLPDGAEPSQVFLSYYDENEKEWVYAGGEVDTNRSVVVLQITHASWWMPTTWNWEAWIAVLNKILRVSIVDWIEAVQLLTDDCPQTGEYVQVDSSQARNIVQGCVEQDDAERPELRVVNPKSFFFEIRPISRGNGYPSPALLSPGEDLEFEVSTSDPSPLIIEAQITEKSSWHLVVHMVITMLPGANQFGIQGHHIACITERLADVSYFASAAESLLVDHNGAAAAENISQFMLDSDAVRRFITAADDCNFGPAPTWSVEGIRQIGGAVSTIMSATDYIANYLAGNTYAQVSFVWAPPALVPEEVIASRANEVILAIKNRDMETLSTFVHPTRGVRFSPYAFVQESNLVFMPDQIRGILADRTKYTWGAYDGTGFPIELTFEEYYEEFIYDQDFANAEEIGYNRTIRLGNYIDNSMEFYPGAIVVEYHFPGFDPKFQGMDWESLRLVFQEEGQIWYLVGIIHDEWTI